MDETMLTTIDNPYDPFEQFISWYMFDVEKGHFTCSYLARIVELSDDMTQDEINAELDRAMDQIIRNDFENKYIKVTQKAQDITPNEG